MSGQAFAGLFILYNVLAFGSQPIFGFAADSFRAPRFAAVGGCALAAAAAGMAASFPTAAIIAAGLGNAAFHVGGGTIALSLDPGKAAAPGIYVAPGALGVLAGTLLGRHWNSAAWPVIAALGLLCALMLGVRTPAVNYGRRAAAEPPRFKLILVLALVAIFGRALAGTALVFPWKSHMELLVALTAATAAGKAFGGVLGDLFGWLRTSVAALLLSIPFIVFFPHLAVLAIFGVFLFNIAMPITLALISGLLPGNPGFAFGLTCLALLAGSLPSFNAILLPVLGGKWIVFSVACLAALSLYAALKNYVPGEIKCVN